MPVGKVSVPRPSVAVVVPVTGHPKALEHLVTSLLHETTYGNFEVLLVVDERRGEASNRETAQRWWRHPRVRVIDQTASSAARAVDAASIASEAQFLALVPPDTIDLDPDWLEKFLLLAERRPRLLLACPRTRWQAASDSASPVEDSFEYCWDWDAPVSSRTEPGNRWRRVLTRFCLAPTRYCF